MIDTDRQERSKKSILNFRSSTIYSTCSAAGNYLPPVFIFKGKNLWRSLCQYRPIGSAYTVRPSGLMEGPNFRSWFNEGFIKYCSKLTGPKVLFFDGHASNISLEIIYLAINNNIELICLPPHSSSFLQPIDVGVFKTVKCNWKKYLKTFFMKTRFKKEEKVIYVKEVYSTQRNEPKNK